MAVDVSFYLCNGLCTHRFDSMAVTTGLHDIVHAGVACTQHGDCDDAYFCSYTVGGGSECRRSLELCDAKSLAAAAGTLGAVTPRMV